VTFWIRTYTRGKRTVEVVFALLSFFVFFESFPSGVFANFIGSVAGFKGFFALVFLPLLVSPSSTNKKGDYPVTPIATQKNISAFLVFFTFLLTIS